MTTVTERVKELLGEARVVVLDGESVDGVGDSEHVLRGLLAGVSGGALTPASFVGVEGARRRIEFSLGAARCVLDAEGDTDWLDSSAVVGGVNRALPALGEARRLVEFHAEELGQLSAWALVTPDEFRRLLELGLEHGGMSLVHGDGVQLGPASEDRGGDPAEWDALLTAR